MEKLVGDDGIGLAKLENLTYELLHVKAPSWYRNPDFQIVFSDHSAYNQLAEIAPLELAPGLDSVLLSENPPSSDFFCTLPTPDNKLLWGVYAVLMTKLDHPDKLYIGSGTQSQAGVQQRMSHYYPGSSYISSNVRRAFQEGFGVSHVGLLCWTSIPSPGHLPKVRARVLALEALLSFIFHAGTQASTDIYVQEVLLWPRGSVLWEPLCSHTPLMEAIRGGLELSPEELELTAAIRLANERKIKDAASKRHRAKKRAEDETLYKAEVTRAKMAWSEKNHSKVLKIAEKVRNKAKESHRFHCEECNIPFASDSALQKHKTTQAHQDQVAGIKKPAELSKNALSLKEARERNKMKNLYSCRACDKSFPNQWSLTRHEATSLHKKCLAKQTGNI